MIMIFRNDRHTISNKIKKQTKKWKTGIGFLNFKLFNCRRNLIIKRNYIKKKRTMIRK